VNGDLIVGADRVSIGGEVRGNLYVFSRNLELTGRSRLDHRRGRGPRDRGEVAGSIYTSPTGCASRRAATRRATSRASATTS
jgi:hypothetical protein